MPATEGQVTKKEQFEPYALFGDKRGDLNGGDLDLLLGDNTLSLDLFADKRSKKFLESVVIDFAIVDDLDKEQSPVASGGELLDTNVADLLVEGLPIAHEWKVELGLHDFNNNKFLQMIQDGGNTDLSTPLQSLAIAATALNNNPQTMW